MADSKKYWDAEIKGEKCKADHGSYLYSLAKYEVFSELINKPEWIIEKGLEAQKKLEEEYGER